MIGGNLITVNYQGCRQLLADMGIWSPLRPGRFNPRLHWGDQQGQPISGAYLNETDTGVAYFTLNIKCILKEDEEFWSDLPLPLVADRDKAHRNIYPQDGKEREALFQLFLGSQRRYSGHG